MKRYLAFFGDDYYPSQGMGDFLADFDTVEECQDAINNKVKEEGIGREYYLSDDDYLKSIWDCKWATIFDTQTKEEKWFDKNGLY